MTEVDFERCSGEQTLAMLDEITELYDMINGEFSYYSDPIFGKASFVKRTKHQARRDGFDLVVARANGRLIGFSFGLPFSPGGWWADAELPAEEILNASKFAVVELDLHSDYRGKGLGKELLNRLLEGRREEFATLAAMTESPAYAMYLHLGWRKVGEIGGEGPVMDALLIPLAIEPY